MHIRWAGPAVALLVLSSSLGRAQTAAPGFPPSSVAEGTLSFDGRGTPGPFTGVTNTVRGKMTGGETLAAVNGWVEAPVATLHTDNDRRDRDLRKSMETDKYPTMRFDLDSVVPGGAGDSVSVTLKGRLRIHGVERNVSLPGSVVKRDGGLRLRSDFPLNLKDYHIGGLTKLMGLLRMHEDIVVHVDLTFRPGATAETPG